MKKKLLLSLLYPSFVVCMQNDKTMMTESHFHFSQKGQRSPKVTKILPARTPSNSLSDIAEEKNRGTDSQRVSPDNAASFDIYTKTGFMQQVPIEVAAELTTEEKEVKKECTKFKLLILTSATALVSSGVTAVVTYFNSKC